MRHFKAKHGVTVSAVPPIPTASVKILVTQRVLAALDFDPSPIDGRDGLRPRTGLEEGMGDAVPSPAHSARFSFIEAEALIGRRTETAAAQYRQELGIPLGPLISLPMFEVLPQHV